MPLLRGLTPKALEVFDFAEQGMVTGRRDTTTVAPQALYLLNDPFVRQQARAFVQRLQRRSEDDTTCIKLAYRLALGREASTREIARAKSYFAEYQAAARILEGSDDPRSAAWASFCQALLASAEFRFIR